MKLYDYNKAREIIEREAANLASAILGMREDWSWTGQTVWEGGEWKVQLFAGDIVSEHDAYIAFRKGGGSLFDTKYDHILICGITGSDWATPCLLLTFKDGTEKMLEVSTGKSELAGPPAGFELGCISGPAQERLPPISKEG